MEENSNLAGIKTIVFMIFYLQRLEGKLKNLVLTCLKEWVQRVRSIVNRNVNEHLKK